MKPAVGRGKETAGTGWVLCGQGFQKQAEQLRYVIQQNHLGKK